MHTTARVFGELIMPISAYILFISPSSKGHPETNQCYPIAQ